MNPRDLPVLVAESTSELPEVRAALRSIREEMHTTPERISPAMPKSPEPSLNRLLVHGDQLKNHASRLGKPENPQ